jgi:hypothetical protein
VRFSLLEPLGISGLNVLLHVKCIKESINRGLCLRDQFFCSGNCQPYQARGAIRPCPTRNESRPASTIREGGRDGEGDRQLAYGTGRNEMWAKASECDHEALNKRDPVHAAWERRRHRSIKSLRPARVNCCASPWGFDVRGAERRESQFELLKQAREPRTSVLGRTNRRRR